MHEFEAGIAAFSPAVWSRFYRSQQCILARAYLTQLLSQNLLAICFICWALLSPLAFEDKLYNIPIDFV